MMKLNKSGLLFIVVLLLGMSAEGQQERVAESIVQKSFDPGLLLWYGSPAKTWNDALPVGNGRLAAMVFGNPDKERIQFNEDTYWTGGPYSSVVTGGKQYLPEVQDLVFKGKWLEAQKLFGRELMGYPVEQQKYQPLGNLELQFENGGSADHYKRWLDLRTGTTGVDYQVGQKKFHREVFASIPDQVIVIRLTADQKNSLSLSATLRGVRNQDHSNYGTDYFKMNSSGNHTLVLSGKSADYLGIRGQLKYEARLKAVCEGGTMAVNGDYLEIKGANSVTLYLVAATNFVNYKDVSADQKERVDQYLKHFQDKSFEEIQKAQVSQYQQQFNRVSLHLPATSESFLPTDERLQNNVGSSDPSLSALAYQFGRYVLIASSQPGTQAANLQGIWNEDSNPMWDSKYTTNINLQMNYWPVASANLAECAEPLFQLVKDVTDQGSQVAREHYGCQGWVLHQNTDLWKVAAPMDGPTWGTFTTAGAWLCNQLWQQYLFSGDSAYLQKIYPLIKGSVQFFMDFLVKEPGGKWYVTNPSSSPENFPKRPGDGRYFDEVTGSFIPGTNICAGASIDMEILEDLFSYYVTAAAALHEDAGFAARVAERKKWLLPPQIGKDGSLQEWAQDWGQTERQHRHLSPLYGLYPGTVFSATATPQLMDACRAVLIQRGDSSTEWSRAWKVCLWARMRDGNRSNSILKGYFRDGCHQQLFSGEGRVMQIDGTMGVTAGISEMLLQSQEGTLVLLPALPDEWKEGELDGVCAQGAFEISMKWSSGKITALDILSKQGGTCRLNAGKKITLSHNGKKIRVKNTTGSSVEFGTVKGGHYIFNDK